MPIISAIAADEIDKLREALVRTMAQSIARPDHHTASDRHFRLASALLDATVATLRTGSPPMFDTTVAIDRSSAGRFGDALVPVLKDVVGHGMPPSAFSRVIDAYWRMIESVGAPIAKA